MNGFYLFFLSQHSVIMPKQQQNRLAWVDRQRDDQPHLIWINTASCLPQPVQWQRALGLLVLVAMLLLGCAPPAKRIAYDTTDRKADLRRQLNQMPVTTRAAATLQRARLLRALGEQEQALSELEQALAVALEALKWNDLDALRREVGAIHIERGQPEKALAVFGKRLEAAVSLNQPKRRASALVDTAYAFALLSHLLQADDAVTQAHVIAGDALLKDPVTVERLGLIAALLNDGAKARFYLLDAADEYVALADRVSAARARVLAANLTAKQEGDARPLTRLESLVAKQADPESLSLLRRYQAERDLAEHQYQRCERRAAEAVALADARGLQRISKIGRVLAARCADENGHLAQAIAYARQAGGIAERELRAVVGDRSRQQLSYEAYLIYRLLLGLQARRPAPDRVAQAFITSERARARSHVDAMARQQLGKLPFRPPVSEALEHNRKVAEERVKRMTRAMLKGNRNANKRSAQRDALWALADIKETIARANPLLSRVTPPDPASIADVRDKLLGEDTALLSYFVTDDKVYLFAVDQQRATLIELEVTPEELTNAVKHYRKRLLLQPGSKVAAVKKAGRRLFDMVIGPAALQLSDKRRLVVVPHGALSSLPFESLVNGDNRYLIEDYQLTYTVSATVATALAQRQRASGPRKSFVGMGDPVFDWDAYSHGRPETGKGAASRGLELWTAAESETDSRLRGLERLPGTARELRAIGKLFGRDQKIYLRANASEALVKDGAFAGYRLVHVASHGLLGKRYQAVALTLRPDAKEDGFLMNSEIAELKLDADLVVLSACRTGVSNRV
ncbi:MAG TPA: CHAT domain-containing protein, partial [Sorangium sp.]|nr:CHAT domain-containing protein [Sorangium sp.]